MRHVVIGGTFEYLHAGHRRLLEAAAEEGDLVTVGVSTDAFAESIREREVEAFDDRWRRVEEFMEGLWTDFEVKPLRSPFGDTLERDYDAIVVSPETESVAEEINRRRREAGRDPMEIVFVGYVMAEDGKPISSTRIHGGEIDGEGNLL
ncbi:MAG: Phosphopantetheine adenylyltransferase [Methanonatronarchaeales archaeon]|nr:Phosphopantetheine adenylyltransferase [Methanonatronarchaeales archaeon]